MSSRPAHSWDLTRRLTPHFERVESQFKRPVYRHPIACRRQANAANSWVWTESPRNWIVRFASSGARDAVRLKRSSGLHASVGCAEHDAGELPLVCNAAVITSSHGRQNGQRDESAVCAVLLLWPGRGGASSTGAEGGDGGRSADDICRLVPAERAKLELKRALDKRACVLFASTGCP
eukprot:scaffold14840_cov66-Phaeocystis_antarctica.AAC.9